MELQNLLFEKKGHLGLLTFNRPSANAWNLGMMEDLKIALDTIEADKEVRVLILTGSGKKCFSAGFDLSDAGNAEKTSALGQTLWRRIDRFAKPVIAAINGHALGGGFELALCCHFRIMAEDSGANIGLTELNLGIIPGWGGTQRLMQVIGKSKALDMILFSKKLSATEALAIGIVDGIFPAETLLEKALEMGETLAARPPLAVAGVLQAMAAGLYEGVDAGLKMEDEMSDKVMVSKDAMEGFTAFFEKRPPVFKGE